MVVKEVEKIVEKVVYKDRVKTVVITKPDGTRIESREDIKVTTETTDKLVEEVKSHDTIKSRSDSTVVTNNLSRYSVGGYYSYGLSDLQRTVNISVGARLGNLPIFLEVMGEPKKKSIGLGVRVEF